MTAAGGSRPAAARTRAPRDRGEDSTTVAKVIDAAIDCILEEGYYRASSNQIARRAGVTWGVIQYHFGTREGLLLAVFQHSADKLIDILENATITGETTAERLESLADVMWSYYRQPEFLAYLQVMLNLTHDPTTAEDTVATLTMLNQKTFGLWQQILAKALPPDHQQAQTARALFDILRGVAIGQELTDAVPGLGRPRPATDPARVVLLRALTHYIETADTADPSER